MVELLVRMQDLQRGNLLDLVMIHLHSHKSRTDENFEQNEESQSEENRDPSDLLLDLLKKDFPMIDI